jgi:hypothetical protein
MPKVRSASNIDFALLMQPTAKALLGESNPLLSKPPHDVRWGTNGSLSINFQTGQFYDHENKIGGGTLDLIQHKIGCDRRGAVSWLREQKLLTAKMNGHAGTVARESVVAAFEYTDEAGNIEFAVERIEFWNPDGTPVLKDDKPKKTFRQKRPDPERPGGWIYDTKGCGVLLYRLPELIEAVANGHPICIVEGEAKVDLLRSWGVPATCCAGGSGKWRAEHSAFLRGADAVLMPDADDAGARHVQQVGASLAGITKRTRVLMLPGLPPKGDVIDFANAGGTREQLDALIEKAPAWVPLEKKPDVKEAPKTAAKAREDELIGALAAMEPGIEYGQKRQEAADEFKVRPTDIDAEVRRVREDREATPLYGHWITEPSPEPVEGDDLLRDIIKKLRKHVVCTQEQALTVALWIMFAWVHDDAAVHSPVLAITSAEPESGKSTMLSLVAFLTPRCIASVEISKAALFRAIKAWSPSFAIDEFDDVLSSINGDRTELRSVVNSGHTRGTGIIRCVTDEH